MEWNDGSDAFVTTQSTIGLPGNRRGRVDILVHEEDDSYLIIEAKATDWGAKADYRMRRNILRHVRQLIKYVMSFWENGIDVSPGVIYPRSPLSAERRAEIGNTLDELSIQVVWASGRGQD